MDYKVNRAIELANINVKGIDRFHEIILPFSLNISQTMNEGGKTFTDFVNLLWEAEKFKEWLSEEEPSQDILEAYCAKLEENAWLTTTNGKKLRWLLFSALGLVVGTSIGGPIGTAASLGLGGFNALIFDSLLKQYKPSQFVNDEYVDYLGTRI